MINVIVSVRVKEGKVPEYLEIFKANVPNVRAEAGCIEYFPAVDVATGFPVQVLDKNTVTILEKWESLDALRDHLKMPHMQTYREKVKDLVENTVLKVVEEA